MDSLFDALERMRQPAFWEALVRLHNQAADYRQEIDSLRSVKRFNPKFANEQIAELEQLWKAVANAAGELCEVHRRAEIVIRKECPELLGGLPIVDGITLDSLNPTNCAAMVKDTLGRYLKLAGTSLIQSLVNDCYMSLNNLLPGPVDDRLKPDKVSRLIELHNAYMRLVDSGFMNAGGDPFATQAVEYRSIVASSYARVIAELSWRSIDSVLQVGRSQGVWYDRFARDISAEQISELRGKQSSELSKAAASIVSQDDLFHVWELFQVEIELCERKAIAQKEDPASNAEATDDLHTVNMKRGIALHRQGISWPDIAEALYNSRDSEPSCTKAIKTYAKKHKITLTKRTPGRRQKQ